MLGELHKISTWEPPKWISPEISSTKFRAKFHVPVFSLVFYCLFHSTSLKEVVTLSTLKKEKKKRIKHHFSMPKWNQTCITIYLDKQNIQQDQPLNSFSKKPIYKIFFKIYYLYKFPLILFFGKLLTGSVSNFFRIILIFRNHNFYPWMLKLSSLKFYLKGRKKI